MPTASGLDPVFDAGAAVVHDLLGRATTVRRPHNVRRVDRGTVPGNFEVKTTAALGAGSVICQVNDGGAKDATGTIYGGTVLVINAVSYTVQSDTNPTASAWTLTVLPILAAEATAGDAVTLPDAATFTDFTRLDRSVSSTTYNPLGFSAGTKIFEIRYPDTLPAGFSALRGGNAGDYLSDTTDGNLGRITQILDDSPEGVEVVVG